MDKKVNVAMLTFYTFEGVYPLKKKKEKYVKDLKAEEFYKIYQEYKSTGIYWRFEDVV
ncbi:hypothetical protein NW731_02030 [Mycoplasmopsis felis]|uniref:hypothetical protein n=1 Tax=Mycoplasmopsis felis TaxID=33923 RepID=UPI0021E0426E|nr:hypothetical protein [Mycoplasmopsis felis]MCU9937277.1 hypothetical protein [Mycoplasmopsis felis]